MLLFNPLEQFEIIPLINTFIVRFLTMFFFNAFYVTLSIVLFIILLSSDCSTTNHYNTFLIIFFGIIKSTVFENLTLYRQIYFPVLFFLFLFIFNSNIMGLIPFGFTLTSSFIVTFFLSLTYFIAINIIMVYNKNWKMMTAFLPNGVPLELVLMLITIELISYFARVFSLSIRLFANMMSGHALLKILSGFSWTLLSSKNLAVKFISLIPWVIVSIVLGLEILIAFLQAYVFTILITMYLNESFSSH